MTLLTIVQNACDVLSIPRPSAVIGSASQQVRQLLAIANNEAKHLAREYEWQALQKEATFSTVATELQGTLESKAPGINWALTLSFWNRTLTAGVRGGLSPEEWQFKKAVLVAGIYSEFRIKEGSIYLFPVPAAGQTIAFEYISKYWRRTSAGVPGETWSSDTDTSVLDEYLIELGVIYRWLRQKRLSYAEEMREYATQVELAKVRDGGGKPVLNLDCDATFERPAGVLIPEGNWNL